MSVVTVQAWHCDRCGYEWLKTGKQPLRCANPQKRCRNWHLPVSVFEKANPVLTDTVKPNWDLVYPSTRQRK